MIKSLRGRLFVGLTAMILLTGAIGAMFAYNWAFGEAIELQDSILIQLASLAQNASFSGGQPLHGVDEDTEVWLIELGKTPRGSGDDRQLFTLQEGLQVATWKNQPVRVLLKTRSDGSRFAVAQLTAVRDETARGVALRTLLPIAALIPCLMVVTALVVAHSLRPTARLARDLDARRADDMTPLPLLGTPSELQPFIASINALLKRMRLLMDQQRRFLADAAHELRTPITALSLQAENLDSVALSKVARERAAVLKQGMHRTKHLLEQLLALARHEATPSGPAEMPLASLDRVAKEVAADLVAEATDRGIHLGFALVEPVMVHSEAAMLAAILRNLLENAIRFTPRDGTVDVGVYRENDIGILQVEDTGPGIASADMDQIFEPFFRGSRPEEEGTGLGLSIVKRIVDNLGGEIALENIAGAGRSGLRATVRLPVAGDSDSVGSEEVEKPKGSERTHS
ncbi:sensor histidine kinase [Bradyrhizobium genomosp. I (2014)]|uniref:sensor histidine kinase n=1 Tax=Bradyrhizobium genomosp. I (2014) TaxID=2683269 RepID=UPI0004B854C9|nr:ATP-binding protein [Bradyrhizobium sp. CCBAU 43298]